MLEDLDDITRENQKLKQFESEQDIAGIYGAIKSLQFSQAIGLIDEFIKKYHSVAVYQDVDITALKLEIRLLEHELNAYDSEKAELEKLLADFNYQHNQTLGELIGEILALKKNNLPNKIMTKPLIKKPSKTKKSLMSNGKNKKPKPIMS